MPMRISPHGIDVTSGGAVVLGQEIACDGFFYGMKARIQSHAHSDHMRGFDTSKGCQDIFLSRATRDLIQLEDHADLPYRRNIRPVPFRERVEVNGCTFTLRSSGHMLGAVQTEVQTREGFRLGYSGDFEWPLEDPIHVDALVVDSTYGSPRSIRKYSQQHANDRLVEEVNARLSRGPIAVVAHRGTLQRALEVLDGCVKAPFVAHRAVCREAAVYSAHGFSIPAIISAESDEGRQVMCDRHIRVCRPGDLQRFCQANMAQIVLSAYWTSPDDPVLEVSDNSVRVALSDHADFQGTVDYVRETGANVVITDNSRGGHAVELALELRRLLGVDARPSGQVRTREWGA